MPQDGFKSITVSEETYNQIERLQKPLRQRSNSAVIDILVEDKIKEIGEMKE